MAACSEEEDRDSLNASEDYRNHTKLCSSSCLLLRFLLMTIALSSSQQARWRQGHPEEQTFHIGNKEQEHHFYL
jgi:hypothetical protein